MLTRTFRWLAVCGGFVVLFGIVKATTPGPNPAQAQPAGGPPAPAATRPAGPGLAPLTIELSGVPSELELPAGARNNYMVTAIIRGAAPTDVWVARSADSPFSVPVRPFGDGRYQINLADDRVVLALRRTGNNGQCFVFARTPDGRVFESAAIRFSLRGPTASFQFRQGEPANSTGTFITQGVSWCMPDRVTELSVRVDPSLPGLSAVADTGGRAWALQSRGEKDEREQFALAMTPEIRMAWEAAGQLEVRLDPALHQPYRVVLKRIPEKIELPPDGLYVTGKAQSTVPVPGTNGYLSFHIGQVHDKGADAALRRADESRGRPGDPPLHVAQVFRMAKAQYVWVVHATPPGRDEDRTATLRICEGVTAEHYIINTLIARLRESTNHGGSRMQFNGKGYSAGETYDQLIELYKRSGEGSINSFVEAIKEREQETASQAKIGRPGDRETVAVTEWLIHESRKLGWEPLAAAGPATAPSAQAAPVQAPPAPAAPPVAVQAAAATAAETSPPARTPQP